MSLPSSNQSLASTQFASDDRLRTLFESVAAGIVIQSAQGPILYANQMAAEIFGMSRNDVEGRTSFDPKWQMITEAGRPVAGEQHPSMITVRTGRPLRGEIRGIFAGDPDRTRWLMINTDPLRDPDTGDVTEALITFTDVTDRKHAETALRESEQLLNETGRVAQVGGWEHDLRTGRALWTPTLYDIIEIEPGAPIPGPSEHLNYYAPADRARLAEAYQRCIDTGEPFDLELQCHTARGRPLWSRAIGEAVFENGQCVKLRGTFQDISTRKTAENALRESEYRFRQIYENMAVGVARVSLAFRIESANDAYCRMLGYTEDELIGKRLADITHPEALPENLRQQARLGAGEIDHFRMEKRFIHRTGRVVHGILDANLVRNADGKPLYFLGSVLDVTGRKRAEEALLESEKKFRLLFERSPDAHVIFAKGGLQDCNQACLDMLGIANRDELLSRHPGHISPPRQPDGQDSSEKAEQQIALAYANGSHRFEWTCQRPDGELVELDVLLNAITLQGEPAIHAVWRDITDRKRAEAELARHRKHLEVNSSTSAPPSSKPPTRSCSARSASPPWASSPPPSATSYVTPSARSTRPFTPCAPCSASRAPTSPTCSIAPTATSNAVTASSRSFSTMRATCRPSSSAPTSMTG